FATWVEVVLKARTVVAGTEGSSQVQFFLPGVATVCSPFGIATSCACDERTDPICLTSLTAPPQCLVLPLPVTITTGNTTHLPPAGGTFVFLVSGGTQTSYNLMTTFGTLSASNVAFNQSFTLTLSANTSITTRRTITLTATDAVSGQLGTLTLTQCFI